MSSKRRPTDDQLGALLTTPHFGRDSELVPADPVAPTPMVLALEQIKPYDRNPRRERNPRFDEIKESIQSQRGLNNPITVTKRPNETLYMVESGGNTRLEILKQLYQETGDKVFHHVHVLYRPWQSESHVLTAHLIENEKRGEMLFIDKALAVRDLKAMFETETQESLSLRKLTDRLKEVGYAIDASMISRMDYALDILLPVIPEALRAGMGKPQIEKIRRTEKAFLSYWVEIAQQDGETFAEVFFDALAEHNRPEWEHDALRITLEEKLSELLDIPVRAMRLDIDALMHGKSVEPEPTNSPRIPEPKHHNDDAGSPVSIDERTQGTETSTPPVSGTTPPRQSTTTGNAAMPPESDREKPEQEGSITQWRDSTQPNTGEARQHIYQLATTLAAAYNLDACIHDSPAWGLGFVVDVPDSPLVTDNVQELDAESRWNIIIRQWVWWILYLCSEETARPERIPALSESLKIKQLCLEGNQRELLRLLGQPVWVSMSCQLFAEPQVPDEHFDTLIAIIRHCRQLRANLSPDNEALLWVEHDGHEFP